ncbi:MAG: hypothetical protein RBG13Loki_2614 [Promethearchaeota archaeon CR_4]|nr:MAG: hypothetical protein RBG13Loki_2614 [Candidatus Lokiarchaeota archaeon CR_4]
MSRSLIIESKKTRYLFLDNIKVLFTILVIFWHTTNTYMEGGWWYYKESNVIDPITEVAFFIIFAVGGIFQTSLLGLFFLLGGYFTPNSYDRKGARAFWKERLVRIGIPLLIYSVFINPLLIYAVSRLGLPTPETNPMLQGSFLDYYFSIHFFEMARPMWFLKVLLIFTAIYTLGRQFIKLGAIQRKIPREISIPRYTHLLLLAIGLGCLTFLVRIFYNIDNRPLEIPLGQLIQYFLLFSVGVICIRHRWFEKMSKKQVKIWVITILSVVVLVFLDLLFVVGTYGNLNDFSGGANFHAFLFAVVDNVICIGMIFVMVKVFYAKFNTQEPILRNLSASAYHMYLLHPPVALSIALVLSSLALSPILKLAFVFLLTILTCYLTSHYIIQKINLKK